MGLAMDSRDVGGRPRLKAVRLLPCRLAGIHRLCDVVIRENAVSVTWSVTSPE